MMSKTKTKGISTIEDFDRFLSRKKLTHLNEFSVREGMRARWVDYPDLDSLRRAVAAILDNPDRKCSIVNMTYTETAVYVSVVFVGDLWC